MLRLLLLLPDYSPVFMSMSENALKAQLLEQLNQDDLDLPSLPSVAQRIEKAFEDKLVTAQTIGVIIQSDPVISAKLIKVANSPLYAGRVPVEAVNQAITRMGFKVTRRLVMGFVVSELFYASSASMKDRMQSIWKESVHVASLCRLLSERLPGFDQEQAQLAGLVHNIGGVVILNHLKDKPEVLANDVLLHELFSSLGPQVSAMLLKRWHFGEAFVQMAREHVNWMRDGGQQADLCDLVILARYHALIGSRQQRELPPVASLPAFGKANMDALSIDEIMVFLEASREKLKSISTSLGFF